MDWTFKCRLLTEIIDTPAAPEATESESGRVFWSIPQFNNQRGGVRDGPLKILQDGRSVCKYSRAEISGNNAAAERVSAERFLQLLQALW